MKFPSLKNLAESTTDAIKRHPFEMLFAFAGTIAATIEIELRHLNRVNEGWCIRVMMIANLGLLLSLSATLYTRSVGMARGKGLVIKLIAALFAAVLIFIIDPAVRNADYTRFFLMSLAFHLLVAFAAFTGKGQLQGFWQFNRILFLRFLLSVQFGVALFLGIAAAIGATNFLFNFNFEWDTYAILWAWIAGVFVTIVFLAGVPMETRLLDEDQSYPKGLKIFTQYVLIPLATVYVIILLAYEIKILVEWNLPKGLVSNLILGYSVFGILSLLLVYPVREHDENKWIKTFSRSFYFLLIPLLGLLFVAVGARVFKYGITELRYFLILLACWLLFISVYFLLFKKQNIKLIPVSLCILTLLSIYGPQSAFSVSMYSQRRIIIRFFEKNNAFKNGKLMPVDSNKISRSEGGLLAGRLDYFITQYDLLPLQPYFNRDLSYVVDSLGKKYGPFNEKKLTDRYELRNKKYEWAKNELGLRKFNAYNRRYDNIESKGNDLVYYHINKQGTVLDTRGYDFMIDPGQLKDTTNEKFNGFPIQHIILKNKATILKINNETISFDPSDIIRKILADNTALKSFNEKNDDPSYDHQYAIPAERMSVTAESKSFQIKLIIDDLNFGTSGNKIDITYVRYLYLIKRK